MKVFYYLCFFFIVAGLLNLKKVGLGASRLKTVCHFIFRRLPDLGFSLLLSPGAIQQASQPG
jgi:hypothetical protein